MSSTDDRSSNMEFYFQQLHDWACKNDMEVNLNKTKEIGPPSKIQLLLPLQFPTAHDERVNSAKLPRINLNADFSWKSHVEAITSKATQIMYFLKQLRRAGFSNPTCSISTLQPATTELNTGTLNPVVAVSSACLFLT